MAVSMNVYKDVAIVSTGPKDGAFSLGPHMVKGQKDSPSLVYTDTNPVLM